MRYVQNLCFEQTENLLIYVIGGSSHNSDKTGHVSADLATGRSQPTKLEKALINWAGEKLEVELPQKYR